MATILRMKRPDKNAEEKKKPSKKALYPVSSFNDLNELSSKSLLANVLNTNDSFGVLKINKFKSKMLNDKINNIYSQYSNGIPILRRENSGISQSTCEYSSEGGFTGSRNEMSLLKRSLNAILKELRCMTQKLKDDEEEEEQELNWKFAAMVSIFIQFNT